MYQECNISDEEIRKWESKLALRYCWTS